VRKIGLLFLLSNVIWFAACGGNGNSNNNSTVTSVAVSCSPSTITSGQTSQCTATVSGTGNFNSTVTWSTSAGTITSAGLFTGPGTDASLQVTITATSTQNTSISGTATVTVNPQTTSNNVAPIIVDSGPPGGGGQINVAYITVTVCVPGTNTCQNIDHVQVDTGSSGLRLLSTASGGEFNPSALTQETVGGNPLDECLVFADGYVWGGVYTATVTVAGETASNVPIHVLIPASQSPGVPSTCSSQNPSGGNGNEGGSVMALGSNGILGVGPFQNDCGQYCVQDGSSCNGTMMTPCVYYQCPSSGCTATNVGTSQQVPNPVTMFGTDNNGVLVQLPSLANSNNEGTNVAGSLIFGIGTQSNNSLSLAANVYFVPDATSNAGNIITVFNGQSYPQSFLDSGSNGLYFLDSATTGIATCPGGGNNSDFYCPTNSPDNLSATNQGQNNSGPVGSPITVNFTIENALNLFNSGNTAFSTLGGPFPAAFDFGLSFFYGKNVFTAIDLQPVSGCGNGCTGPFFAY
jgi:hypothetical protein